MAEKGEQMVADNHYAKEFITSKCKELYSMKDEFENKIKQREDHLKKAMDIHESLEQVQFGTLIVL